MSKREREKERKKEGRQRQGGERVRNSSNHHVLKIHKPTKNQ
jgi:hypothetical protein